MTEREYIDATNLAKIRTAMRILADTLAMHEDERKFQMAAGHALRDWEERLEKIVKTRG